MITDKDIQKLKSVFATKDDLGKFATKDDLKKFATKDDLKKFATKDDLVAFEGRIDKKFATKDDLKKAVKPLVTKKDLSSFSDQIIEFITLSDKANGDEMREHVNSLAKEISSIVTNHEGRIKDLEKHSFPTN